MSLFDVGKNGDIVVHGNLDRDTLSTNFWQRLSSQQQESLKNAGTCTVDLGDVERVDSAGLAWLINAVRDTNQNGVSMVIQHMPAKLHKLAKISDVDSFLPVK